MNFHVPRKRAKRSAMRAHVSGSYVGRSSVRRGSFGWSIRARRRSSRATVTAGVVGRALTPVGRQQVVEYVVDGDGAEQVVGVVDDGNRDEVVGREVRRPLGEGDVGAERADVAVRDPRNKRAGWLP